MKKIAFYQPHLDIRGSGVANYEYAKYTESILGHKSFIICDKNDHRTDPRAEKKFKKDLNVIELPGHENMQALADVLRSEHIDALYIHKCGLKNDGRYTDAVPLFIHVCGMENDSHGLVYAYISKWGARTLSNNIHPWVPLPVYLPKIETNLRKKLNIPDDAIVFGRYGGLDTWDIPWVNDVIKHILNEKTNYYFLFALTPVFIDHPRVIFAEPFAELEYKSMFINTCDAMIHARSYGETFGMAIAEFSYLNKPVITYELSSQRAHIDMLGERGIYYKNTKDLYNIFKNFKVDSAKDWNAYTEFTPDKVMQKFKKVFIDAL